MAIKNVSSETPSVSISVIIVTWNNEATINLCLESIISQNLEFGFEIILVDNHSSDKTLVEIQNYPITKIIRNETNLGFCTANNIGFDLSSGEYVLFLNPDAAISPGFFETAVKIIRKYPECALLACKVHRMDLKGDPVLVDGRQVIDTVGIELLRNRQAIDTGSTELDEGQYEQEGEIFGVSGAVCFGRKKALLEAMVAGQLFDETFFAYKEDVDLSWRLNKIGWKCIYSPKLLAFHARGWKESIRGREKIPKEVRFHSFKNRRMMILKNESLNTFIPDLIPILWFEVRALIYILIKEWFLIKAYWFVIQATPHILRWRKSISSKIATNLYSTTKSY